MQALCKMTERSGDILHNARRFPPLCDVPPLRFRNKEAKQNFSFLFLEGI